MRKLKKSQQGSWVFETVDCSEQFLEVNCFDKAQPQDHQSNNYIVVSVAQSRQFIIAQPIKLDSNQIVRASFLKWSLFTKMHDLLEWFSKASTQKQTIFDRSWVVWFSEEMKKTWKNSKKLEKIMIFCIFLIKSGGLIVKFVLVLRQRLQ